MEQIIPIVIAALIFGFQSYQNYQKEQEKARKRKLGRPADHLPEADGQPEQRPAERKPEPDFSFLDELKEAFFPEEAVDPKPAKPTRTAPRPAPKPAPNPFQEYEGAMVPDEVRKLRENRRTPARPAFAAAASRSSEQTPQKVTLEDLDDDGHVAGSGHSRIDLREAMIHSIILERPYKD